MTQWWGIFRHDKSIMQKDDCELLALDKESFKQWEAEQHQEDEEPMEKPLHPLDPATFTALIRLVLPPIPERGVSVRSLSLGFKRFLILAMYIDDDLAAKGLNYIASILTDAGMKTTRASLSQIHCQLAEITCNTRLGKSAGAREAYSRSAKQVWALRDRKPRNKAQNGLQEQATTAGK